MTDEYVRFGPGVPAQPTPENRSRRRMIIPLMVLILVIGVLIYFLWGRTSSPVAVSSVSVTPSATTVTCGQTEHLSAVIATNGGSGKLTYQWVRSDGTTSDVLTQNVSKGQHQTTVDLLWNFDGPGTFDATATLHILSPGNASGSAAFHYRCTKS